MGTPESVGIPKPESETREIDPTYRGYVSCRLLTSKLPLAGDFFPKALAKYKLTEYEMIGGELEYLGMDISELEGRVLDVGVGGARSLLQALQNGIDMYGMELALRARVGGTHPGVTTQIREQVALENLEIVKAVYPQRLIEADAAKAIPFGDDYFNMVMACLSLPDYARNREEAATFILEGIRVATKKVAFVTRYHSPPQVETMMQAGIGKTIFDFRLAGFLESLKPYGVQIGWREVVDPSPHSEGNIISAHLEVIGKDNERLKAERSKILESLSAFTG